MALAKPTQLFIAGLGNMTHPATRHRCAGPVYGSTHELTLYFLALVKSLSTDLLRG